jgi:hypothetical protein
MVAYPLSPGIEGFPRVGAAAPYGEGVGVHQVALDIDWAELHAARLAAGLPALVAGDTVIAGSLPAGAYLVACGVNVVKASPAAAVVTLSTGGANIMTMNTGTLGWTDGGIGGAGLTVATNLILTFTGVPASGQGRFTMLVADLA